MLGSTCAVGIQARCPPQYAQREWDSTALSDTAYVVVVVDRQNYTTICRIRPENHR